VAPLRSFTADNTASAARVRDHGPSRRSCLIPAVGHRRVLYDAPPAAQPPKQAIPFVDSVTAENRADGGRGRIRMSRGAHVHQDRGAKIRDPLGARKYAYRVGKIDIRCSRSRKSAAAPGFPDARPNPVTARKRWNRRIAWSRGQRLTSTPARDRRCRAGQSLLPAGLSGSTGNFARPATPVVVRLPPTPTRSVAALSPNAPSEERPDKIQGPLVFRMPPQNSRLSGRPCRDGSPRRSGDLGRQGVRLPQSFASMSRAGRSSREHFNALDTGM